GGRMFNLRQGSRTNAGQHKQDSETMGVHRDSSDFRHKALLNRFWDSWPEPALCLSCASIDISSFARIRTVGEGPALLFASHLGDPAWQEQTSCFRSGK